MLTFGGILTGPIVRVTPYEVHIKDPQWYHELYCSFGEGIRDKYGPSAHMTGTPLGSKFILIATHRGNTFR